jgi:hypothetical protein
MSFDTDFNGAIPYVDPIPLGIEIWHDIEQVAEEEALKHIPPPRVMSFNTPFGVEGIPYSPPTPTGYLMALGIDFPSIVTGWRIWLRQTGSLTVTIKRHNPILGIAETTIGTCTVTGAAFDYSNTPWTTNLLPDDILNVYVSGASGFENGLFRIRLQDRSAPIQ